MISRQFSCLSSFSQLMISSHMHVHFNQCKTATRFLWNFSQAHYDETSETNQNDEFQQAA